MEARPADAPCATLPQIVSSNGILNDGGMRYGTYHHADGVGVYADACPRFEDFSPWEENALLELRMHASITKARDGTPGRYVMKSEDQIVWQQLELIVQLAKWKRYSV